MAICNRTNPIVIRVTRLYHNFCCIWSSRSEEQHPPLDGTFSLHGDDVIVCLTFEIGIVMQRLEQQATEAGVEHYIPCIPCSNLYWYKIDLFRFLSPNQYEIPG